MSISRITATELSNQANFFTRRDKHTFEASKVHDVDDTIFDTFARELFRK